MARNLRDWPSTWPQEIELNARDVRTVAESSTIGGIPVVYMIPIPDAATGDVDVVVDEKIRVIDAYAIKTAGAGGAANTVQVKSGSNAITQAIDINIADTTVARATLINDANWVVAAGGTLKVTRTKAGGNAACLVVVTAVKVA